MVSRSGLGIPALLSLLLISGCGGDDSPAGPDPDTTPPEITLEISESLVQSDGTVVVTATATDNVGVVRVEILKGGVEVATLNQAPWEYAVACTSAENGVHEYAARAHDGAGNSSLSETRTLTVAIDVTFGLVNANFDAGVEGWTLHNLELNNAYSADGGNPGGCLRLNSNGPCDTDPGAEQEVSGFVPGLRFRISGDYKPYAPSWGWPTVDGFAITVDSLLVGLMPRGPNDLDWSPFSVEFTATAEAHMVGVFAEWECNDSSYDVDNLVVEVVE